MDISSRTPEGDPSCCPVCGKDARIDPSTVPTSDAPCPRCGSLLWFPIKLPISVITIHRLLNEIARLSEMELTNAEYYQEFLQRLLIALAAPAGAVWLRSPHGNLLLQVQIGLLKIGLDRNETVRQMHDELLCQALIHGQPAQLPPRSQVEATDASRRPVGNPTEYVILIAPILYEKQPMGLIEVWQEAS